MFHFRSNGKLLLTGEYLVLKGANALALPTKLGQDLRIEASVEPQIHWTSTVKGQGWFRADFNLHDFALIASNDMEIAKKLQEILQTAMELNPQFLYKSQGVEVESNIEFDRNWGLGSSSTLVSNVAQWANCDPYLLNRMVFKGSGYDIACATSATPLIYHLKNGIPQVEAVSFQPEFKNQLWFIWLNEKQNSRNEIARFNQNLPYYSEINAINEITAEMLNCADLASFQGLMEKHEDIISRLIQMPTVRQTHFSDFNGSLKSLGAWGGDFILAASDWSENDLKNYFKQKGFITVLNYDQLIKTLA
ncbi:MAG: GYDIA family GHMP kinase [Prolixibacteraceae bacterium]